MYHERAKGKDVVVRKLRPDEVEYLSQFCMVEPFLYELKMNFPPHFNPQNASGVVKGLYFEFRKNRRYKVIKELKPHEVTKCKNAGLEPRPYKYRIYLKTLR
jgi:hypothetical protein